MLERPDGVELYWDVQGEGPMLVFCPIAYADATIRSEFLADMARDHAVLTYHPRGTGASTRSGPYELDADVADLIALLEAAGPAQVGVGNGEGTWRLIRAAVERPDLLNAVVVSGAQSLSRSEARGLAGSRAVLDALMTLMETDYRAGLRTSFERVNPGATEDELRRQVDEAEQHCPQDAWLGRLRDWIRRDVGAEAAALGERLWVLHHGTNPWFGTSTEAERAALPDACFVEVSDGLRDAAAENAAIVRKVAQTLRASSG